MIEDRSEFPDQSPDPDERPAGEPEESNEAKPPAEPPQGNEADDAATDATETDATEIDDAEIEDAVVAEDEAVTPEGTRVPVALAATDEPVQLRIGLVEDERTPEGMVCMATYRGDRLVARCVLPPEAFQELEEHGIFEDPVPVVLVAQEAPPGLQCRLFAMIALPEGLEEDEDEEAEPWAASVPSSGYEAAVADAGAEEAEEEDPLDLLHAGEDDLDEDADEDEDEEDEDDARIVPLPLGNIVRYERDRVHRESLAREAMDILQKVIEGQTYEVVDRALADLLGL